MSFPWSLTCYESLGSTSDFCKNQAEEGAPNGLAVLARRQTAGRGTRGRAWTAPEGNLSLSFLLRHEAIETLVRVMPFLVAVAVHEALRSCLPQARLQLKWPNDIICDGAKLCGVLIERGGEPGSAWIVTGIGANLMTAPEIEGGKRSLLQLLAPGLPLKIWPRVFSNNSASGSIVGSAMASSRFAWPGLIGRMSRARGLRFRGVPII
ncbi:biotin--[acetyl-CoA-carboxylase] ligase [Asaia platycodi]|uniref:biotin--[acetyl-CoA-carboxylase] ligase n=1 Tax=Asaia platycodi TaxID=610243 RepID=UPI0009DCB46F|nr:biotin--[acetyl-CoA-carboxylase] ligase [Asaia platycodi]